MMKKNDLPDSSDSLQLTLKSRTKNEKNLEKMIGKTGYKMFTSKWSKLLYYQMVFIGKALTILYRVIL